MPGEPIGPVGQGQSPGNHKFYVGLGTGAPGFERFQMMTCLVTPSGPESGEDHARTVMFNVPGERHTNHVRVERVSKNMGDCITFQRPCARIVEIARKGFGLIFVTRAVCGQKTIREMHDRRHMMVGCVHDHAAGIAAHGVRACAVFGFRVHFLQGPGPDQVVVFDSHVRPHLFDGAD